MEQHDIAPKVAFTALTEFMRDRICMLGGGTGNLLSIGPKNYIATCYHVAKDFFPDSRYRYATFRRNDRISKSDLTLVSYKGDPLDIALIEILAPMPDYPTYTLDSLARIETFDSESLKDTAVMVSGTPGELSEEKPEGVFYTTLTFLTLPLQSHLPSADFLYCQYPTQSSVFENPSNKKLNLPAAPGLSGAFIIKIPFQDVRNSIWSSAVARVVAIQHRWNRSNSYIKGTNIKHLIELIP